MNTGEVIALIKAFGGGGGGSSGGGVLVVGITNVGSSYISNKTAAEIYAAIKTGAVVFSDTDYDEVYVCTHAYIDSNVYYFDVASLQFSAQTGADYPTASLE